MADEEITVLAKLKAKEAMEEEVKEQCMLLIEPTRHEAGCISYDFHQDTEDKCSFMFYENWTSKQALDEHIQKPHIQQFMAKAEELLAEPVNITIWKKFD